MKKIFSFAKRELRSHFDHPAGYVMTVVLLGLALFLYFRSTLVMNEASLRPLFGILPWLLLFFVPAITMRALAADEKEGTSEVFLAQPVTALQYLIGKFLGSLAVVMIGILGTLPALAVLARYGSFDVGLVAAQYLGALFLAAALTAIGFFASGLTKNQIIAFILGIGIIFGFIIIGWEATLGSISPGAAALMQQVSILWHFENVTRGVLDLRDVFYFLTLVAVFGVLAYAGFVRKRLSSFSPASRRLHSWVVAIIALAVVWNGAAQYIPARLDLTSGRIYTLSPATKRILAGLTGDVAVKLYASQNLPTETLLAQRDVTDALADYRTYGKGKLSVEVIHPESDAQKQEAANAGIPPIQFNVMRKGEFQVKEGFFGLTVGMKDSRAEVIPYISKTDDFEYQLTRLIHRLSGGERKTVAFLSGHGEVASSGYNSLREELGKSFVVDTADIATATSLGSSALAHADVLVIGGLTEAISDKETLLVKEYLSKGGKLFVLADGATINFSSLTAAPSATSVIESIKLLTGVGVHPSIVYDLRSNDTVQFSSGGPMSFVLPYPFWARVGAGSETPIMKDLRSVVLSWGASLDIPSSQEGGTSYEKLLITSPAAGEQRDAFVLHPNAEFPIDKNALGERTVGVIVKNLFGGNGRAVVVGSSSMLSDQIVRGKPENVAFGLNVIDWLAENEDLISIRSKISGGRILEFSSEGEQNAVRYMVMLGIPALIVAAGALRLLARRRKTRRVFA